MPRGLKEKDPHIVRPSGHGGWGPLKTFLRILPQMPSLGRIRTGKRYGALPLERNPQTRINEGIGYSKKPSKRLDLKLLCVCQSQLEVFHPKWTCGTNPSNGLYFIRPDSYNNKATYKIIMDILR